MLKAYTFLFFVIIFSSISHTLPAQDLIFANRAGGTTPDSFSEQGNNVVISTTGNTYVTGSIGNAAVFGEGEINETIISGNGSFLAKYLETGELEWVQFLGGFNNGITSYSVDLDANENVYVSGTFFQQTILGAGQANETTLSGTSGEIFIAKYDLNGNLIWALNEGGPQDDNAGGRALKVNDAGDIFLTGNFWGTVTFGEGEANETTLMGEKTDILIAKYNTNGELQWAQKAGGSNSDGGKNIDLDDNGNIIITGSYFDSATFGEGLSNETFLDDSNVSGFLAKYDVNGNFIWAIEPFSTVTSDISGDVKFDKEGNILFTGSFFGTITLGAGTSNETQVTGNGGEDIIVAKYNADGEFLWAKTAGSTEDDRGVGLAVDTISNVFITGYFGNPIQFGASERNDTTIVNTGSKDLFIAKYAPSGEFIWVTSAGSTDWDQGVDIEVDVPGNSYVTGFYTGDIIFGENETNETTLGIEGPKDIFFSKFERSFNREPEFEIIGETVLLEDFGTETYTINQINTLAEELDQVVNYSISPQTSDVVNINFNSSSGILELTSIENVFGEVTFTISADDGAKERYSYTKEFTVQVQPVNDAPVITGFINSLSTLEDTPLVIEPSDFEVIDPDNQFPEDFTLTIIDGINYTASNNELYPETNFNGLISVGVIVNDGTADSEIFLTSVEVIPVNDSPIIVEALTSITTKEDTPLVLQVSDFEIIDPDNVFPDEFTLEVFLGDDYTFSDNEIIPSTDFNGILTVPVLINDGMADSEVFLVSIEVTPVNDIPVVTGTVNPVSTSEDTAFIIDLSNLEVEDPDHQFPGDFTLTILEGTSYTFTNNEITPAVDFNGLLKVNLKVSDGVDLSEVYELPVEVEPVNDPPVIIDAITSYTTQEDIPLVLELADFEVLDPDNLFPDEFTLKVVPGSDYTFSNRAIIPSTDFNGTLTVPVILNDGIADSETLLISVEVTPVNDVPLVLGTVNPVSTSEDTPFIIDLSNLQVEDPDHQFPGDFTLVILEGTNYTFTDNEITPAVDFNGVLNVNLKVSDGMDLSEVYLLSVEVEPVNDPPVISSFQGEETILRNGSIAMNLSDFIIIDADNDDIDQFTLEILEGDNYTVEDNLVKLDYDFFGTVYVTILINDGQAFSEEFVIAIEVSEILAIEDLISGKSINFYPNPTNDFIQIDAQWQQPIDVKIYTTNGKLMISKEVKITEGNLIDLSDLRNGVYIIQLTSGDKLESGKLIKN